VGAKPGERSDRNRHLAGATDQFGTHILLLTDGIALVSIPGANSREVGLAPRDQATSGRCRLKPRQPGPKGEGGESFEGLTLGQLPKPADTPAVASLLPGDGMPRHDRLPVPS
jgi:hypothetical protein